MALILRAAALLVLVARSADAQWQPQVVWQRELGEGFAAMAVAGDRLVTMYRRGGDEVVVALDRARLPPGSAARRGR